MIDSHTFKLPFITLFVVIQSIGWTQDVITKYSYEEPLMGTTFRIVLFHNDKLEADEAVAKAFKRIEYLNSIFSNYSLESEAMSIKSTPHKVSEDMWKVLITSRDLYHQSNGLFDVTIGPVSKLWRKAIRNGVLPTDTLLKEAQFSVGMNLLNMNDATREVYFVKDGMILDFGGIAKGYAVDEAYKVLKEEGIKYALVDGGGDIYAGDHPANGWKVNFSSNRDQNYFKEQAITSSGAEYQKVHVESDIYSHIIHPEKGMGVKNQETTYVVGPSCTIADALSTIISIDKESEIISKYYPEYKTY